MGTELKSGFDWIEKIKLFSVSSLVQLKVKFLSLHPLLGRRDIEEVKTTVLTGEI